MDEMDYASRTSEFLTDVALRNKKPELPQTGRCHNCEEPIASGKFCDADCREDYDKRRFFNVA